MFSPESSASRVVSPWLAGRRSELSTLRALAERAAGGRSSTVLVSGEPGIGKSRLIGAVAAGLEANWLAVTGSCLELGAEQLTFAPLLPVVAKLVGAGPAPEPDSALAALLPADPSSPRTTGTISRFQILRELVALIERVASTRPLLVVIEDLHWADPATLELFAYLARNLDGQRVLLAGTLRTGELPRGHPVRQLLAELGRLPVVTSLQLGPLDRGEVGVQLTAIDGRYDPARAAAVHRRSGGNPLFVEALMAAGSTGGPTGGAADSAIDTLRALLLERVAGLPVAARHVLAVASVTGGACRHELLALLVESGEDELEAALRELVEREQLVPTESGYRFRHDLIREAVYRDLLPGQRRRLHAGVAGALTEHPELAVQGRPTAELAEHWYLGGKPKRAYAAALRAADEARAVSAYEEELRLLERALDLKEGDDADRLPLLERAVAAAGPAGAAERGLRLCDEAYAELDAGREPERVARLLRDRALFRNRIDLSGRADLERALALLPPDPPTLLLGTIHQALAADDAVARRDAPCREHAGVALRIAEAIGDEGLRCFALATLGLAESNVGAIDEALAMQAEAQRIAVAAGNVFALTTSTLWEVYGRMQGGRYEEVAVEAPAAIRRVDRLGMRRRWSPMLTGCRAIALWALGRWDEAIDAAEETLTDHPETLGATVLGAVLAAVHIGRGDLQRASPLVADAVELADGSPTMRRYMFSLATVRSCELALARHRPEDVDELVGDYLRFVEGQPDAVGNHAEGLLAVARVLRAGTAAAPRNRALAARAADRRSRLATLVERIGAGPPEDAYRHTLHAELGEGRLADWDRAVDAWRDLGHLPELTWCLIRSAEVALATSNRAGAQRRLREAHELATALRAPLLLEHIDALGQRARLELGQRAGLETTPRAANPAGLTGRELDVLRVLAQGRSNRQIAAELFISAGTVSVHVSRILTKLGVATRTEAATLARDQGLL